MRGTAAGLWRRIARGFSRRPTPQLQVPLVACPRNQPSLTVQCEGCLAVAMPVAEANSPLRTSCELSFGVVRTDNGAQPVLPRLVHHLEIQPQSGRDIAVDIERARRERLPCHDRAAPAVNDDHRGVERPP